MKHALLTLMFFAAACGSGDGPGGDEGASDKFNQTNVSGMVSGTAWTYAAGRVMMGVVPGSEANVGKFEFVSSTAADDICDAITLDPTDKKAVTFTAALIPGETPFGASGKSATFYDNTAGDNHNTTAFEGKYSLDNIAAGSVSGRLIAYADDNNSVNGIFSVPRCCKAANDVDYEVCSTI